MADGSLHQPHDKLFKTGFENPATARSFFEQHLAPEVFHAIDWDSLEFDKNSFVSPEMLHAESDLLYTARLRGASGEQQCMLYILWEHASTKNRFALLNLLSYMVAIWKRYLEHNKRARLLPPVLPVLLTQNEHRWDIPDQFRSLFPGSGEVGCALEPYLVDFRSRVIQLAELGMGDIRGTPECVVVLRVMKVAVSRDWENELLWDEELLSMLGENMFQRVMLYILSLSDLDKGEIRRIFSKVENKELRSKTMSVAEQFIEEGRQEGLQKGRQEGRQEGEWIGKIQMLEQFLGRPSTPKAEFEGCDVKWLESKFRELEEDYNKRIKGK
jgi:predicted transposase/invertase (TIGR01784 family)